MFKKLIITFFCFCLYLSNCLANQVEFSFYKKGLFSFSSMVPFSFDCIGNGKNNLKLFIYLSYVTAFDFNMKLVGTNGIFEIYDSKAKLLLGHKKDAKTKRYCRSSVSKEWKLSEQDIMKYSLEESINYFLNICLKKKNFLESDFKNSIEINKQILKSKKSLINKYV